MRETSRQFVILARGKMKGHVHISVSFLNKEHVNLRGRSRITSGRWHLTRGSLRCFSGAGVYKELALNVNHEETVDSSDMSGAGDLTNRTNTCSDCVFIHIRAGGNAFRKCCTCVFYLCVRPHTS